MKLLQELHCHCLYHQLSQLIASWQTVCQLCFHFRSMGKSWNDRIFFFFSEEEKRMKIGEESGDQYLPLQLRHAYMNMGIGQINDQNQFSDCLLQSGKKVGQDCSRLANTKPVLSAGYSILNLYRQIKEDTVGSINIGKFFFWVGPLYPTPWNLKFGVGYGVQ